MRLRTCIIISIIACFWVIIPTGHSLAEKPDQLPKVSIEKTVFAFSPVIAGTEVTHIFTVGNKGEAPLNIPGIYAE